MIDSIRGFSMKTKLSLIASCLAWFCLPSMAQSVEIYGIVDAGVGRVTNLAGGTKNFTFSGIMEGTRLGFRGNELIAPGYRAIFTLENRIELDSGGVGVRPLSGGVLPDRITNAKLLGLPATAQPLVSQIAAGLGSRAGVNVDNKFWDRQAYLGLVTPFGAGRPPIHLGLRNSEQLRHPGHPVELGRWPGRSPAHGDRYSPEQHPYVPHPARGLDRLTHGRARRGQR
jgi:Gram-negative porin